VRICDACMLANCAYIGLAEVIKEADQRRERKWSVIIIIIIIFCILKIVHMLHKAIYSVIFTYSRYREQHATYLLTYCNHSAVYVSLYIRTGSSPVAERRCAYKSHRHCA